MCEVLEFLATFKPYLTIADEGASRDLVGRTGIGSVVAPSDIEEIAAELERLRRLVVAGAFPYPDTTKLLQPYDRRCTAGRLAAVLDRVVAR